MRPLAAKIDQALVGVHTQQEHQTTEDDQGNAGLVNASAVPENKYRKAKAHKVKLGSPIQLKDILALKDEADRSQGYWESVWDTEISDPQPDEIYFRDCKVPPEEDSTFLFEEKEPEDGYSWVKHVVGYLQSNTFIHNVMYFNQARQTFQNTKSCLVKELLYVYH